ncbi:signal peptidase I [Agrobacterium vitis]|uniref:signal peptidase I n=1 Tax=Agrobacterium vitis TaxID=373 RepID=UPI0012E7F5A3|nr:signal peptidase I [Agrobacterium vitis]MVA21085.1 signal peptidase I [Agrobacterium vitis]
MINFITAFLTHIQSFSKELPLKFVSAFRKRNPIWAACLALALSPAIGFFYLGIGRLGLLYMLADVFIVYVFPFILKYQGVQQHDLIFILVVVIYRLGGSFHVYIAASRQPPLDRYPWFARFHNLAIVLIIVPLLIALAIRNLLIQPFSIVSGPMLPTLEVGDYVFSEKLTYGMSRYSIMKGLGPSPRIGGRLPLRGEVVIFMLPSYSGNELVNRVIGLPGDRIQMRSGRLYINDTLVDRQRIGPDETRPGSPGILYLERLPGGAEHQIIEMTDKSKGDNSAELLVPDGHYFMMGDNRDNSNDSRFDLGFVPTENIASRPFLILFNSHLLSRSWLPIK